MAAVPKPGIPMAGIPKPGVLNRQIHHTPDSDTPEALRGIFQRKCLFSLGPEWGN